MALISISKNESIVFQDSVQDAINIAAHIEELAVAAGVGPSVMPPSTIPTDKLYDIVKAYEALYKIMLDAMYLQSGNLKSSQNNIH